MSDICVYEQNQNLFAAPFCAHDKHEERQAKPTISPIILVIDDEEIERRKAELLLKPFLCKIVTLSSAEDGIKYLYENFENVILILSDIDLPQMSGLEFLSEIKQNKIFKRIPVILQTGDGVVQASQCLKLGAAAFLRKPYSRNTAYMYLEFSK